MIGRESIFRGTAFDATTFSARTLPEYRGVVGQQGGGIGLFDTVGTAFGSAVGGAANVLIAVVVGTVIGYAGARLSVKGKKSRR